MNTTSDEAKQMRLLWLVRAGYVLMAVGALLLLLLSVLLPVNLFDGPNHYYRVVPTEHGWMLPAALVGLGTLLVLIGKGRRARGR